MSDYELVQKFGGSSMAEMEQVQAIVEDTDPQAVVVSAPGRGPNEATKLTNDLIEFAEDRDPQVHAAIRDRLERHASQFGSFAVDIAHATASEIYTGSDEQVKASGERYSAQVFAHLINGEFVDATEVIFLKKSRGNGPEIDVDRTHEAIRARAAATDKTLIIPGFYGIDWRNKVRTLPRGGSDITGAVVAAALQADTYQNWTDQNGIKTAHPERIPGALTVPEMTYKEVRAYGRVGTEAFQVDSVEHLFGTGVATNIRNTFEPNNEGTRITDTRELDATELIVGLTGREGLVYVRIESHGLNDRLGEIGTFGDLLQDLNISIDHMPTGKDDMSAVITPEAMEKAEIDPDELERAVKSRLGGAYEVEVGTTGALCLVGEGQQDGHRKTKTNFRADQIFMRKVIPTLGEDSFRGVLSTRFVPDEHVDPGLKGLHTAFFEEETPGTPLAH